MEKYTKRVQTEVGNDVQKHRRGGDGIEGRADILAKAVLVPLAEADGKQRAASHAQANQDTGQQRHKRIGASNSGQRHGAQELSHNHSIRHIVHLLQQVSRNEGKAEQNQAAPDISLG